MTETNPTPPAWALAHKTWRYTASLPRTHEAAAEIAFRAGYEAASARPAASAVDRALREIDALDVNELGDTECWRRTRRILRAALAAAPPPPSSGSIKDHLPSADWLRRHVETDPDWDTEAGSPPPPVGDHKALIEEAAEIRSGIRYGRGALSRGDKDRINACLRDLAAALSQRADEGWRDIATAPRDGTEIEVAEFKGRARWGKLSGLPAMWEGEESWFGEDQATHWRPLPPGADEGAGG